jgi:hypothetical protein
MPRQPLSRRPQSTTLAPPPYSIFSPIHRGLLRRRERDSNPRWAMKPTAVFKTAALVHSAIPPILGRGIPPGRGDSTTPELEVQRRRPDGKSTIFLERDKPMTSWEKNQDFNLTLWDYFVYTIHSLNRRSINKPKRYRPREIQ